MDAGVDEVPYDGLLTHPPDLLVVDVGNPEEHLQLVAVDGRVCGRAVLAAEIKEQGRVDN